MPLTRLCLSKFGCMQEVVSNEILLHGEVFTVKVFSVVCEGRRRQLLSMIWWEIEGFHLTVGDGYRKLGRHGREMILRRNGDSHLVDVEFKDGLLGCKKSMLRDLTGLVKHKNSDVAGHSAAAVVDERRATSSTIDLSRCETVESHTSKFLLLHCVVHVLLEGAEKLHNLLTSVVKRQSL